MLRASIAALALLPLLGGCDAPWSDAGDRAETAREFPAADRPVAPIVSTKWSTEEARDRVNEADDVMNSADVRAGMTVADIGPGDGTSEEHTSEPQSLTRTSYGVSCLKKKNSR